MIQMQQKYNQLKATTQSQHVTIKQLQLELANKYAENDRLLSQLHSEQVLRHKQEHQQNDIQRILQQQDTVVSQSINQLNSYNNHEFVGGQLQPIIDAEHEQRLQHDDTVEDNLIIDETEQYYQQEALQQHNDQDQEIRSDHE